MAHALQKANSIWAAMVFLLMLNFSRAFGQNVSTEISIGKTYRFTVPVVVTNYDYVRRRLALGINGDTITYVAKAGFLFNVVDVATGGYIIQFPAFVGGNNSDKLNAALVQRSQQQQQQRMQEQQNQQMKAQEQQMREQQVQQKLQPLSPQMQKMLEEKELRERQQLLKKSQLERQSPLMLQQDPGTNETPLFFFVSSVALDQKVINYFAKTRILEPDVAGGTVIIPVKMRFNQFDFSRDFALGLTIGPRWRMTSYRDYYINWLFAFNVNIATIDSASSGGKVRQTTDKGALGAATGVVFDFNGPQVGVFLGWDWLSNRDKIATNWRYQGKPWISAGLGFTIFTRNPTSSAIQPTTQKSSGSPPK